MSALLRNLLHFGELLRALGLDVPAAGMLDVTSALAHVEIGRRSDFYFTLRSLLVRRPQDLAVFDEAFLLFWRRPTTAWSPHDLRAMGERRRIGPPERETSGSGAASNAGIASGTETVDRVAPMSYGEREVLRRKDFAQFTEQELVEARALVEGLRWSPDVRRTRRWTAARRGDPDLRHLVTRSLRHGGEPLVIPARERRWRTRPLVLLCDVSGSMERYARVLLHFTLAMGERRARRPGRPGASWRAGEFEAFLFATRLTRVTREIQQVGADRAVSQVIKHTSDWGGGTRIGDALRTFNVVWARRVTGRGPMVLLISDGWDRGDPAHLSREMARLSRAVYRVIWLNPLLGSPAYQPLTRGMQAALPFIDDFLPVHNLVSLEALAAHLNALPPAPRARGTRRRSGPSTSARPIPAGADQLGP